MERSSEPPAGPVGAGQARLLATGSLVQQGVQVTGLLALLAIVTVLARRLSLDEFGVYGLLSSLAGYLLVIQNSAASAAVRNMAAATSQDARDRTFSTGALIYAGAGALTGLLIAGVGVILSVAVDLDPGLREQAQLGAVLLGVVTAVGWPITIYRDAMRAHQLFVRAAGVEMVALVLFAALVLGATYAGANLAVLIAASGTIPLFAGLGAAIATRVSGLPFHFTPGAAHARRPKTSHGWPGTSRSPRPRASWSTPSTGWSSASSPRRPPSASTRAPCAPTTCSAR